MTKLTPAVVQRLQEHQEVLGDLAITEGNEEAIRQLLDGLVYDYKGDEAARINNAGIAAQVDYLWSLPPERTEYATVVAGPDQLIVISRESGAEHYLAELSDSDGNLAETLGRFRDLTAAYAFIPVMLDVAAQERRALWASYDDDARREMRDNDLSNLHAAGARVSGGVR